MEVFSVRQILKMPTLKAHREVVNGHESFVATCPKCKAELIHSAAEGHRAAHCRCWDEGYILEEDKN